MRKLAALWVALQGLLLAGWAWREEARLAAGTVVVVRPEPIDARDLLRGHALELRYSFSSLTRLRTLVPVGLQLPDGGDVWVVLGAQDDAYVLRKVRVEQPRDLVSGEVALRGRVRGSDCAFGIERAYVPEASETPAGELLVRLRVGADGEARIETLLVDGNPWP